MNNKILQILKDKNYVVPSYILNNYKSLNIGFDSFILLVYLINQKEPVLNDFSYISEKLNTNKKDIMISIEELKNKKIIEIKIEENKEKRLEENIYLEPLYNKMFMNLIDEEEVEDNSIYSRFEEEFGRTLSPIEYELINGWQETGYNKEVILEALKEAVLNGVTNLKYVDRILIEWDKKGIKSTAQVKKDKENYSKKKDISIPDFDWVHDEESS